MKTDNIKTYFENLNLEVEMAYGIANIARSKSYDPENKVEIPLTKNMAERVEGLIGVIAPQIVGKHIPERLQELELQYGKLDWRVALTISLEVAQEKFCKFDSKIDAINTGIRVGFAYVTNGVVASPLEGFTGLKIRKRSDGKEYFALCYSGPVRSAGGTGASVSVLIADYIRKTFGYATYDPTEKEIKRAYTELRDYHERITNLQYFPSEEETEFLVSNLPVQIDGDPSEDLEVSNYKDLPRIETNRIRNGFCLVMGECLAQKAKKVSKQLNKWGNDFGFDDWKFMDKFLNIQSKSKSKGSKKEGVLISPDYTFIKDLVAGRPVLTHPMRQGGFRLRYGRARNTGLSSTAIHPATMKVLDRYIAIGTQLKMERPGKGTALSSCESIEGPIVKLNNGNVLFLDENNVDENLDKVNSILFLGDILIPYGDFFNRAHKLVPPGYCEEWWFKELLSKHKDPETISKSTGVSLPIIKELFSNLLKTHISASDAFNVSKKYNIPFHPRYTYHWKDIDAKELLILIEWLLRAVIDKKDEKIIFPYDINKDEYKKEVLEKLGIPHIVSNKEFIVLEKDWAIAFMVSLGFYENELNIKGLVQYIDEKKEILDVINKFSEVKIKDKSGLYIGARMGRPEKGKMRKLTGSPHVLFPVGDEGGRLRCFQAAMTSGKINGDFPLFKCEICNKNTIYSVCESCNSKTIKTYYCAQCKQYMDNPVCGKHGENHTYSNREIDINYYFDSAKTKIKLDTLPELIKGVRGTSNQEHIPENIIKGILRALHSVYVNKDGTIRYDMSEMSLTHFKPIEIGTSMDKLKKLGYDLDIYGKELVEDSQILELKPHDVVLPGCNESDEEGADIVLFRIANFIDDLLKRLYDLKPFYNLKSKEDLIGHLIISLAPHTSAGIIGRIIGFSQTQVCYAHPLWHSAQRRDCDGDENGIMLMLDGFLNFSRKFLPAHRGSTQDACLVLSTNMVPSEVDDMVFDMDVCWEYPLEFYEACEQYKDPYEIKIEQLKQHLGTPREFEGYGYTHETSNINNGVLYSAYKSIPTMEEKVNGQMILANKIRAVDKDDVARLVIERHFIRDLKGNLRKFSMQQFRCVKCNEKFRRPPLKGKCTKCDGKLIFTISEGSVIKYLSHTLMLVANYNIPDYIKQTIELTRQRVESVFGKDVEKQEGLKKWFG
ncbi:DNA polymerase II large subunit [Candidatus Woesearchaeota archaeon]|nr:DNA polymerase II large subunit [Candidatus Woesearchaeota archaeon]